MIFYRVQICLKILFSNFLFIHHEAKVGIWFYIVKTTIQAEICVAKCLKCVAFCSVIQSNSHPYLLVLTLRTQSGPIACASEYYQEYHILCWARMSFLLRYISMTFDIFKDFFPSPSLEINNPNVMTFPDFPWLHEPCDRFELIAWPSCEKPSLSLIVLCFLQAY